MFEQVWSGRLPVFDHFSETDLVGRLTDLGFLEASHGLAEAFWCPNGFGG